MTLIGVHVSREQAVIVSDTFAYTKGLRHLAQSSKVHPLPHIDAVVTSRGDSEFGVAWHVFCADAAMHDTFDDLVAVGPKIGRAAWDQAPSGASPLFAAGYMIGYSAAAQEFQCHMFCADRDFEPEPIEMPHIIPSPLGVRPSSTESRWLRADTEDSPHAAQVAMVIDEWQNSAPITDAMNSHDPTSFAGLAVHAREQRGTAAIAEAFVTLVHGQLLMTQMTLGMISTSRLLEWDEDETFMSMIRGTLHPLSQRGPCPCGEGDKSFLECHMQPALDEPCVCGAEGRTLGECCALEPAADGSVTAPASA